MLCGTLCAFFWVGTPVWPIMQVRLCFGKSRAALPCMYLLKGRRYFVWELPCGHYASRTLLWNSCVAHHADICLGTPMWPILQVRVFRGVPRWPIVRGKVGFGYPVWPIMQVKWFGGLPVWSTMQVKLCFGTPVWPILQLKLCWENYRVDLFGLVLNSHATHYAIQSIFGVPVWPILQFLVWNCREAH